MTFRITMLMATVLFAMAHDADEGDWRTAKEYWDVVNDIDSRAADRLVAENALLHMTEPKMLYTIFYDMYRRPIGLYEGVDRISNLFRGDSLHVGGPEAAEQQGWPQHGFIIRSRMALWDHFTKNAQPEEERIRILLELFDEFESTKELYLLFGASTRNHSPKLEQKLWDIFADRELDASIRSAVITTLTSVANSRYGFRIIEYAWQERGSEVATNLGAWVTHHPLQNALMLDWYDREQARAIERAHPISQDVLDRMDRAFHNITGLYEESLEIRHERQDSIVRQRNSLREKARETGDDTKLREFDAQVAEQQQQELQTRIERIDDWIATNRDRLEQEANDFARRRAEER
jgi:hypothetical protein